MRPFTELARRPGYEGPGEQQHLEPVVPRGVTPSLEWWQRRREEILVQWRELLGQPSFGIFDSTPRVLKRLDLPEARCTLFHQPTGPSSRQLILLMRPRHGTAGLNPGAVVPFYHPDRMAGYDLRSGERIVDTPNVQFGRHLVQQGYIVICTEAFPYNTVPEPEDDAPFAWWRAAAARILEQNPSWSGMGKLVWDTRHATDLLLAQPELDRKRVLIIGHSLGGKMAFYAAAMDERIKATIASDFGIGYTFTNWDAPWYLGARVHVPGLPLGHHHLLALHAPRPFLLLAGDCDGAASRQYLAEAEPVYALYHRESALGFFNHGSGHRPPEHAVRFAYGWLAEQFGQSVPRNLSIG